MLHTTVKGVLLVTAGTARDKDAETLSMSMLEALVPGPLQVEGTGTRRHCNHFFHVGSNEGTCSRGYVAVLGRQGLVC